MAAITGNLPYAAAENSTQRFFNNFYTQQPSISPENYDAVLGYFESITGSVDTGKTLASAVIYTALQQGISPMSIVDQLKVFSTKNKLNSPVYSQETNKNAQDTNQYEPQDGIWVSNGVQNAKPGPSTAYNSINELDAYLTMLLNFNRVGTSLLGLSNSPRTSKYIQRSILA